MEVNKVENESPAPSSRTHHTKVSKVVSIQSLFFLRAYYLLPYKVILFIMFIIHFPG